MTRFPGVFRRGRSCLKPVAKVAVALAGLAAAGCSADVARFDSTSFAFNDPPETGSTAPAPSEPVYSGGVNDPAVARSTPRGPYSAGASSVDVAALPEPAPAAGYVPPVREAQPSYIAPSFRAAGATSPAVPAAATMPAKGEMIEVQSGDTLYGLSRRHSVSLNELMQVNSLSSPALMPGQKLYLPAGAVAAAPQPRATLHARSAPPPVSADVAARYRGTYTVQPGDSLYGIARKNSVRVAELQQVNAITDARRVRPGTVLKVPGIAPVAAAEKIAAPVPPAPPSAAAAPAAPIRVGEAQSMQPTMINGTKVAELSDRVNDTPPVAESKPAVKEDKVATAAPQAEVQAADSVKLRWPAEGRVISSFGGRADGTHNDGINLSVPLGTEVHAAESGVVAYAGSELKGYGNLVLIRHDNGWVTAYAHNDELMVKRGDKVRRGDVVAKAGKTGSVDQPQVHFELRKGSKPVDPTPYMEADN